MSLNGVVARTSYVCGGGGRGGLVPWGGWPDENGSHLAPLMCRPRRSWAVAVLIDLFSVCSNLKVSQMLTLFKNLVASYTW